MPRKSGTKLRSCMHRCNKDVMTVRAYSLRSTGLPDLPQCLSELASLFRRKDSCSEFFFGQTNKSISLLESRSRTNKFMDDAAAQFEQHWADVSGEIKPLRPRRDNESSLLILKKCALHLLGEFNLHPKQLLHLLFIKLSFSCLRCHLC